MSRASDTAYAAIRAAIGSGSLAPGAALREEELAAQCGVSRTPVRDALRRLEAEMVVRRTDGGRVYVADWAADDIDEMFTLRSLLEGHAAARAARRIGAAGLNEMHEINCLLETAVSAESGPDVPGFLAANRAFHAAIVTAAASPRLAAMLARLIEQPVVQRTARLYDRAQLGRSASEHAELLAAFAHADPDWARAVMTAHIRRAYHAFSESYGQG